MKIEAVSILRLFKLEDEYFYEILVQYNNGHINRGVRLPFKTVQKKKEILRFPSVVKVRDWLNTEEGRQFLYETFDKDTQ